MKNETAPSPTTPIRATVPPRLHSPQLFAGGKVVIIVHGGREYQLRITATNKLILTA